MIARMTGIVADVGVGTMILERDGIGYEILVPGYAVGELIACKGQAVTLHTMEYYEGSAAGGNLIPRIVGFLHPEDRAFFERFITVKGIGVRKAIKALASGDILEIVATDVGTRRDIPSWCERSGHTLLSMTEHDKVLRYFVRKA